MPSFTSLLAVTTLALAGTAYGSPAVLSGVSAGDNKVNMWCCPPSNSDGSRRLERYSYASDSGSMTCSYGNDQCTYRNPSGMRVNHRALSDLRLVATSADDAKCPAFAQSRVGNSCPQATGSYSSYSKTYTRTATPSTTTVTTTTTVPLSTTTTTATSTTTTTSLSVSTTTTTTTTTATTTTI